MKQYKIYSNSQKIIAVKQGWSWQAFFFNIIWALVKKMWGLAGKIIVIFFFLGLISGFMSGTNEQVFDIIVHLACIFLSIFFGINGNKWRENYLYTKGYEFKETVNAANSKGAVVLYVKKRSN